MNKKILLWVLSLVLLCSFASAITGTGYDFTNADSSSNTRNGNCNIGQTFTTSSTQYNISNFEILAYKETGLVDNVYFYITNNVCTTKSSCDASNLKSISISPSKFGLTEAKHNITFNLSLSPSTQYYFYSCLDNAINFYQRLDSSSPTYSGGSWYTGSTAETGKDMVFQTYIMPANPPGQSNFTITANIDNFSATLGEEISVGVSANYACLPFSCYNYTTPVDYYVNTQIQLGDNRYDFDSEECTTGDLIEIKRNDDLSGNRYYYCGSTLIESIPSFANQTIGDLYLDRAFESTSGTIVTNVLSNDTSLYNVTLIADDYYNVDYVDYNVSVDLNYNFPFFEVSAVDNGTQLNITNFDVLVDGNWTYNVTNGLVPIYINQSTVNISVFSDGYLTYSDTAHNTSNNLAAQMYDYSVNISFYDTNTSLPYNNSNITIFYPSGYSEVKTTDGNGTIFFDAFVNGLNEIGNYNFQVNSKTGYITPTNISATINQSNLPYNNTYGVDRAFFNITIRDVQTGNLLTQNATVTIGGVGQYTTNTGNLIIRDSSIAAGSYVITTFIAGYDLNTRNVDYTAQEEERLTISMVNETGENIGDWIVTVLDPFYNEFLGADTRLLEYDPVNDVYNEIDSCVTNSNGKCVYSIEIGIKKYIVTASGNIDGLEYLAQSSQTGEVIYFDQDTVNLFLNLKPDFYVSPSLNLDIWYYNDTLVNSTGGDENANISFLSAQFLDSEGNSHQVCIDYYYVDGLNKRNATTVCATGSSGIVKVMGGYILDRSLTWIAEITLVQAGGDKEVVYSFTYQKEDGLEFQLGIYSKFLIILIFIVMLVISLWLKNILIFGVGAIAVQPFVIAMLPSIWDWKIASIIIFLGLILIYLTRKTESLQSV